MTTRLLFLLAFLLANCVSPLFAQTSAQRQQQQQRYQQQQRQQQQYQRQQQLQARQQRLQQMQMRQQQMLRQQQQILNSRQKAAQAQRNANNRTNALNRQRVIRRQTALKLQQQNAINKQIAANRIGRSRAFASSRVGTVSSVKMVVPPARSPQIVQAKAALRTNQLNTLRASLKTRLQAGGTKTTGGGRNGGGDGHEPPSQHASNDNRKIMAGRGSTADPRKGTFSPRNLRERLAVDQAMSKPTTGRVLPLELGDKRWEAKDGWVKMQQTIAPSDGQKPVVVHYVRNTRTGQVDDFKIKDDTPQK